MFDMRDAFSYRNASGQDATPVNGLQGDGIWNREAYHNESVTFDAALAHRVQNRAAALAANQYGPAVSPDYAPGHYLEDYDYLGDRGLTQGADFDLNEQNVRWCVTPEYPAGTYAYFCTIAPDGTPLYPFSTGRQYCGVVSGGTVTSIGETVATHWKGGPDAVMDVTGISRDAGTGATTLAWTSLDGGTYKLESFPGLTGWTDLQTNIASGGTATSRTDNTSGAASHRFYRVSRTAIANYDSTGTGGTGTGGGTQSISTVAPVAGNAGTTLTLTMTLNGAFTPAPPPNKIQPTAVTLTKTGSATITATSSTRNTTTGVVTSSFTILSGTDTGPTTSTPPSVPIPGR